MTKAGAWSLVGHYIEPIKHFFDEDGVTEIMINRWDDIYVEKFGEQWSVPTSFENEEQLNTLVRQIAVALDQQFDADTSPILDARLDDGSRICAVSYPTSALGTCMSIRVFPKKRLQVTDLVNYKALDDEMLEYLKIAVMCSCNILFSGGTGSGKTTLINALSAFIPEKDRIITVEDTQEIIVHNKNWVALEAPSRKDSNVDLGTLIKTTLRKNPCRILIGEIRDGYAAQSFLQAINTGHSGVMSTIHANDPDDALVRVQTLLAMNGDLPFDIVKFQVRGNMDLVVHVESTPNFGRRIVAISEVQNHKVVPLWEFDYRVGKHYRTGNLSEIASKAVKVGVEADFNKHIT